MWVKTSTKVPGYFQNPLRGLKMTTATQERGATVMALLKAL
jgi:hypothetical protein